MVRLYVGRKQPGSTVLLSDSHHVVEVPPHILPSVREGSMVDLTIEIDQKATAERERRFQLLQDDIFKIAEADYFVNTPTALNVYPDITEIEPCMVYVNLTKIPLNAKHLERLNIKYVIEVMDLDEVDPVPGVEIKHYNMEEGTKNIRHLFGEVAGLIQEHTRDGHAVLLYGLPDQVACFAIAYLMKTRDLRLHTAADHIRKRVPGVAPNFAFISQLTQYEEELFGTSDSTYLAQYVMETLPGWDASLEDVKNALETHHNDVAKAMDMLCPSNS